ncbi:glycerol dehydratase reactivase beta/small subunit family protein [Bacillus sp. FJAT-44742]|uniref:glycerol dehydratase reactivase beta/small subunit family protein n=1 Tax=Bacillus sp. FJAT-44742 TaxID=2014005 RepID=UPI000C232452|nr:glycerol dehydratase reactivase beta/small subunit family protein [Bacillus sp. FJAT-44742]
MDNVKVYLPIFYDDNLPSVNLKELCAGIEEEGVPYVVKPIKNENNVISPSPLEVKIIVKEDKMDVFHEKLQKGPYLTKSKGNERLLGKNAARIVKGVSLSIE